MTPMSARDSNLGLFATEARQFAAVLAEGAARVASPGDRLEVRLVTLPASLRSWPGKQTTLMNHIPTGAYAVIKQTDGSRWLYTTTRGTAQIATLQRWTKQPVELFASDSYDDLCSRLEWSLLEAMRHATTDGRSRRATARRFDFNTAHAQREQTRRFQQVAEGTARVSEDELEAYLAWWDTEVDPRMKRMLHGLPVDAETYRLAERAQLIDRWNLTTAP